MLLDLKNNDKARKLVIIILIGILILVVLAPVKGSDKKAVGGEGETEEISSEYYDAADYYEKKLKEILEQSYGTGTMEVMINLRTLEESSGFYGEENEKYAVDGVLIVADVKSIDAISDISFAVCALFDLPVHKVAVIVKK